MIKKITYVAIFIAIFFTVFSIIFAQTPTPQTSTTQTVNGYNSYCIESAACIANDTVNGVAQFTPGGGGQCYGPAESKVTGARYVINGNQFWYDFRARLRTPAGSLPGNTPAYIAVCFSGLSSNDFPGITEICSTGSDATDNIVYGKPYTVDGNAATPYAFLTRLELAVYIKKTGTNTTDGWLFAGFSGPDGITSLSNPVTSNSDGSLPDMEWQDGGFNRQAPTRRWIAIIPDQITTQQPTISPISTGLGAIQQSEFTPSFPDTGSSNVSKVCNVIVWDPDGKVFDSRSLDPIPNVPVTLLKKRADSSFTAVNPLDPLDVPGGGLKNPYLTTADGGFSFLVPDGTYELTPQMSGFNFPSTLSLNSNYSQAYSDIYPNMTGEEIVEKGGPQHRDIPVDSVGQPASFPIQLMGYDIQSDTISSVTIKGHVSHPLANVNIYSVTTDNSGTRIRDRLLTSAITDKNGQFSIAIDQSSLDFSKNEMLGEVEVVKNNFAKISSFVASNVVFEIAPIPTYIDGKAYITAGQLDANAKVSVVENNSQKPYYVTTADQNGHFIITGANLPPMPYHFEYTSPVGKQTTVTTSQFLIENSPYFVDNKINPYNQNKKEKTNSNNNDFFGFSNGIGNQMERQNGNSKVEASKIPKTSNSSPQINTNIIILTIIIVTLFLVTGILGIYLLKKK